MKLEVKDSKNINLPYSFTLRGKNNKYLSNVFAKTKEKALYELKKDVNFYLLDCKLKVDEYEEALEFLENQKEK